MGIHSVFTEKGGSGRETGNLFWSGLINVLFLFALHAVVRVGGWGTLVYYDYLW